jgi:hypothetical protein
MVNGACEIGCLSSYVTKFNHCILWTGLYLVRAHSHYHGKLTFAEHLCSREKKFLGEVKSKMYFAFSCWQSLKDHPVVACPKGSIILKLIRVGVIYALQLDSLSLSLI